MIKKNKTLKFEIHWFTNQESKERDHQIFLPHNYLFLAVIYHGLVGNWEGLHIIHTHKWENFLLFQANTTNRCKERLTQLFHTPLNACPIVHTKRTHWSAFLLLSHFTSLYSLHNALSQNGTKALYIYIYMGQGHSQCRALFGALMSRVSFFHHWWWEWYDGFRTR